MSEFRTIVNAPNAKTKISYSSPVMFIGSCFTENIGNKAAALKINCDINPFGIVYNPVSVKNCFDFITGQRNFDESCFYFHNEQWHSHFHHSRFSHSDKDLFIEGISTRINQSTEVIKSSSHIFITLGTAWVFRHKESGQIVSNCHKLPANSFDRLLIKHDDICNNVQQVINQIRELNQSAEVCFTVSPIRHWKDGAVENTHSKSLLFVAIHELVMKNSNCFYFPSYEIVMDDLRDYRFYEDDMLHVNESGINYIWEKFSDCYFDKSTLALQKEIKKIITAREHRLMGDGREQIKSFAEATLKTINLVKVKLPMLNFNDEINHFSQMLK